MIVRKMIRENLKILSLKKKLLIKDQHLKNQKLTIKNQLKKRNLMKRKKKQKKLLFRLQKLITKKILNLKKKLLPIKNKLQFHLQKLIMIKNLPRKKLADELTLTLANTKREETAANKRPTPEKPKTDDKKPIGKVEALKRDSATGSPREKKGS